MDYMDMEDDSDIPGGDDFEDVTQTLADAGREMEVGSFVFMQGFELQDAMSAIEIGEPRLDTGVTLQEEIRPDFRPRAPLLPEEVCWILDRAFACEMEWHAGNTLSTTVFTILYVHRLDEIDPEDINFEPGIRGDHARTHELVTIVIRAFMMGLLKCCDLSWRELSKDRVHDVEDWQAEKCDISLLEGVPVKYALRALDHAIFWLQRCTEVSQPWREALLSRIHLRQVLLELFDASIFKEPQKFKELIDTAHQHLTAIRAWSPATPAKNSPADLAFDPYIARRLNSFIPLRVCDLPPQLEVWSNIENLIDGWNELHIMSGVSIVSTWDAVGSLEAWSSPKGRRLPYTRSLMQSSFYDGVLVLDRYMPIWIADRFFIETLGITRQRYASDVRDRWISSVEPPLNDLDRRIQRLVIERVKAQWFNPPRRRRHAMKSVFEWHALYALVLEISVDLRPTVGVNPCPTDRASEAILTQLLWIVLDVVFSGFQLELYAPDERVFAYWYAEQVIDKYLTCIDSLMRVVRQDTPLYAEMIFQRAFASALGNMCTGMFLITVPSMKFSKERQRINFIRRYKWALRDEFEDIECPLVPQPDFPLFLSACAQLKQDNSTPSPSGFFASARDTLSSLSNSQPGWAGSWHARRVELVHRLSNTCSGLESVVNNSTASGTTFDSSTLIWDPSRNPWFPST